MICRRIFTKPQAIYGDYSRIWGFEMTSNSMSDFDPQPKGAIWVIIILVLLGFALAVIYFSRGNPDLINGGQPSPSSPVASRQPRVYTVFYGLGVFSPTNIRIHVDDSVRFQNDSKSAMRIVSDITNGLPDLAGFDSVGDVQAGGVFTYTFTTTGIFGYHNAKNPTEEGTIIVRP